MSLIENIVVRVLLYSVDSKPLQFPVIVHYLYMNCGVSTKTYIHLQAMQNPGKIIDEEGH